MGNRADWQDRRMLRPPDSGQHLSRRQVLIGTAAVGVTAIAAACGQAPTVRPEVDDLLTQLELATGDAAAATATATAGSPLAPTFSAIADLREAHAKALAAELARIPGAPTTTRSAASSSASPVSPSADQLRARLQYSAQSAAQSATIHSGYRSGLLGSISAACATAAEVDLG